MTTLAQSYKQHALRFTLIKALDRLVETFIPRRRTVVSAGLLLAGLSIPALITLGGLPFSFLAGVAGLGLVAVGGVLALTSCGEI